MRARWRRELDAAERPDVKEIDLMKVLVESLKQQAATPSKDVTAVTAASNGMSPAGSVEPNEAQRN